MSTVLQVVVGEVEVTAEAMGVAEEAEILALPLVETVRTILHHRLLTTRGSLLQLLLHLRITGEEWLHQEERREEEGRLT